MELVINIITGYLKHNNRIVVPQLGMFIVKPSDGSIIFSELMRTDDGVLRSLLVAYGINELAANGMIDRLRFEIKHTVAEGKKYTIANFGEFSAGQNGTISFRQRREPQVFGGRIKPPIERLEEERLKLQRIQRIRQQQSENITGHSTHRKLRTSQTITTAAARRNDDDDDLSLGKPDRYLKGLKYENRKGRNHEEESYGGHSKRGGGGKIAIIAIIIIALGVGIWFTWQWTQGEGTMHNTTVDNTSSTTEPTDTLATSDLRHDMEHNATTMTTPAPAPALPTTTQSITNTTL